MLSYILHPRFLAAWMVSLFIFLLSLDVALAEDAATKTYTGTIQLVTKGTTDQISNDDSNNAILSRGGNCIAFSSKATNLVSNDVNNREDVFFASVKDGIVTSLEIVDPSNYSTVPIAISADCQYVLFVRTDFIQPGKESNNLYLYNRQNGEKILISKAQDGSPAGGVWGGARMTPDAKFIVFGTYATNMLAQDKNGSDSDIFLFSVNTGNMTLVSISSDGVQANSASFQPTISADGNLIVFATRARNILPDEGSSSADVYLYNYSTRQVTAISNGLPEKATNNYLINYQSASISDDGSRIAFASSSPYNQSHIYLYDVNTSSREELGFTIYPKRSMILSADGSTIAYTWGYPASITYPNHTSYLCLVKITTLQEECLVPPIRLGMEAVGAYALSYDANKILFSGQSQGWIGKKLERFYSDIYYWDRQTEYSISGKIADENNQGLYASIKYSGDVSNEIRTTTTVNGYYTITNLITGTYTITPTASGKTLYPSNATVTVPPNKEVNFSTQQSKQSVVVFIPGIGGSQLIRDVNNGFDEYLWPVIPDAPKKKMTLKPGMEDASIYTDDVVRNFYLFKFYGPFLNTLVSNGYNEYLVDGNPNKRRLSNDCDKSQESATLFVFPWDWRYGIADTVNPSIALSPNNVGLLHEFVQCILRIKGENIEITVIAHSMGGMLTTQYLLKYPADHYIKRVISVGTPYLGAPKAIAAILAGEFDPRIISPGTAKTLLEYFPGAHQLIPNKRYFELAELSPLATYDLLAVGGGNFTFSPVKYENLQSTLKARYKSTDKDAVYPTTVNFMANNEVVSSNPNFTDWSSKPFGVEYHILYGIQQNPWTIGQVKDKVIVYNNGSDIVQGTVVYKDEYAYQMVFGDDTVPIVSASRIGKDGENLNGGIKPLAFKQRKGEDALEHSKLLSNKRIQNCIFFILGKSTTACEDDDLSAVSASNALDVGARYINLWGVTSLRITNGVSTTDELITSTASLENTFPKIKMQFMGSNALSLLLPEDESYMLRAITDEYLQVESAVGNGGTTNQFISYVDVPVEVKSVIDINAASIVPIALLIDTNADHLPDTPVPPTAILTGNEVSDTVPPTVTISLDTQQQTAVIGATDDLSGVARIFYSTNGVDYSRYTAPFKLSVGKTKLYAQAEDKAGNMSSILIQEVVVRDPVQPQPTFSLFLPLVKR